MKVEAPERERTLSPEEAVRVWREFAEGRWRVVALREAAGRRALVLRGGAGAALASRERIAVSLAARGLSNKEVGYELGVAPSTAAGVLAAAAAKLGLRSRRELIAVFGAAAAIARSTPGEAPRSGPGTDP